MTVQFSSPLYIKIDGQMADDILMGNVIQLLVDQHCQLPDLFQIRLSDPGFHYIDSGYFELGTAVEIGSFSADEEPVPLIFGEVTSLEPEFTAGTASFLVVRGFDRSHRLYRELKSRAFVNVKDSDLAQQIANEAGLQTNIQATRLVYEHILQHNESDLALLQARAARIGYLCFVSQQTLHFHPPGQGSGQEVGLTWGENNLEVRPRLSAADQVDELVVRGWDPEKQVPLVGQAQGPELLPAIEMAGAADEQRHSFGSTRAIVVAEQVHSQAEADILARAALTARSGSFVELSGQVFRRPDVQAGCTIALAGIGERFSGRYLVSQASHIYDGASGLQTEFQVQGLRRGLLADSLANGSPAEQAGVMIAIVTNNNDPNQSGRVKLKYPWLTDNAESFWARVLAPGDVALTPAVGEEVLVSFENGDLNRPVVLGKLPRPSADSGGSDEGQNPADSRRFVSRAGHLIELDDGQRKRIAIASQAGHRLELDDSGGQITIQTKNGLSFTLNDNGRAVTINSNGVIKLAASSNLELSANGNVSIRAGAQLSLQGAMVNIN
ncbi:MAG: VgrG-related protein [Anaerolineales bacterium]|nr:VgrG-related protein [Anaerolineales bacterium]